MFSTVGVERHHHELVFMPWIDDLLMENWENPLWQTLNAK